MDHNFKPDPGFTPSVDGIVRNIAEDNCSVCGCKRYTYGGTFTADTLFMFSRNGINFDEIAPECIDWEAEKENHIDQ